MDSFKEHYRFGSAAWATCGDVAGAGLFDCPGPFIGYGADRPMMLDGDAPMITSGGAGSGKLRDLLAYNLCGFQLGEHGWVTPPRILVNDPRGELAAISIGSQVRFGKAAYCINPFRLHGLPRHRLNPWDVLRPGSPTFHADVKLLVGDLIPLSGSSSAEYFELRARQWCESLVQDYAMTFGNVSLPALYDMVNAIEEPDGWSALEGRMLRSPSSDVRRTAHEISTKRKDVPKEYSAIVGEIVKYLGFLSDPVIRETLSCSDFSLEVLCQRDCNVYNMIPAEYASQLAPMLRAIIGAAMLYKQRHPAAPRVLFLIDEAATLGRFESLLRGYTYGRGMGIRVWSIWQDIGQISRNYGRDALSGFIGSSQMRQFFGVRDLDTARVVSAMLGAETLEYDPVLEQMQARLTQAQIIDRLMAGDDPFEAGLHYAYQARAAIHRVKQARPLMAPDEVLNLPEDRQVLFISGLGLMPILADKYPYFTRAEMAGAYLPNPYHPPHDRVRVMTRYGVRIKPVVTERVPDEFADYPQYESGEWSFIKGHRPKRQQPKGSRKRKWRSIVIPEEFYFQL
ncbi:TraM recognition domain-containing protein [Pseudomonas aeruginosa]|uniref:type IV secretory system conjugative DNA transfer family protein n=1 Tax=Pseudomonas aeruginosa TaxID=287 RepID=UPI00190A5C03|nr:type IV secretory system conjugative DNA transfer family protein [Pseudomonas aeruginosa]MBK3752174.1 TraM recognition domain-containing protein [Pseudomonas aeruginosa]MBK3762412.1 TraM recognition domain-containing protein [Pseudomonas aeruginosa]MBK3768952.1 TraM recognition domain-containing protein [Pseudomonas aeruginosa]MBK3789140.1 TraM recognition domain-containing protein [Pseudomonas aeruginosa]MBK3885186.1 TraM recognition domain-containing protein [Pseudomonas aeruginosa]